MESLTDIATPKARVTLHPDTMVILEEEGQMLPRRHPRVMVTTPEARPDASSICSSGGRLLRNFWILSLLVGSLTRTRGVENT